MAGKILFRTTLVLALVLFALAAGSEHLGIGLANTEWWDEIYALFIPFPTGILVSFFVYFLQLLDPASPPPLGPTHQLPL